MVEPRPNHYKVKADQLARIDTEITEEIPAKKLYFISHEDLATTISLEELTCMLCTGIANPAVACQNCAFLFCKPCIDEYLQSASICPVSGCKAQFVAKSPYSFCKKVLDTLEIKCTMESCV